MQVSSHEEDSYYARVRGEFYTDMYSADKELLNPSLNGKTYKFYNQMHVRARTV